MGIFKELQHEYDTTRGLWCIDRNPAEVDYDWIKRSAFQLSDYLKGRDEERGNGIAIGAFTLKQGNKPGKVWMTGSIRANGRVGREGSRRRLAEFFLSADSKEGVSDPSPIIHFPTT